MKITQQPGFKKFEGADSHLQVVRTAPMYAGKQKNFTELIPYPLIPRVSIMWAFLESYLKKTADVYRIYPETRTILEQRIAGLKDSFKLQSEGKTVDAEMAGSQHIMVNYLVRYTLVNTELTADQREELFFNLQKVRALLSNAYGTTPAVIAVDKIDRYVVDLMFMLAESVTKAISDMSDKSWMECNTVLVAVLNVYRNRLNRLLEGFHVFINSAELGGATTPSFHAHAMSQRKDAGIASLPEEDMGDETVLTKKHFERLGPRPLDGSYIGETLEEIAVENFLALAEIADKHYSIIVKEDAEKHFAVEDGDRVIVNTVQEEADLYRFLKLLRDISDNITTITGGGAGFSGFLKDIEQNSIVRLIEKYASFFGEHKRVKGLSPRKRAEDFCFFMKNITAKRRYWELYKDRVFLSPVPEIFAAALMRKIKQRGIEEKIKAIVSETVPEGMKIDFEVTDYFYFDEGEHIIPAFTFTAEPLVWSLYGKPVMEAAEESLNTHWEKIYYITEAYLRSIGDAAAESEIVQKLDDLIGISTILQEMARSGILFESSPNSLLYASGKSGKDDITATTRHYLEYFATCFAFARRKKVLLLPGLCPRATIIELEEDGNKTLKQTIQVSPICVYLPVMELHQFEKRFGPYSLLREANARFEVIGEDSKKFVIQKVGGESRTKGRPVFHRDKREHLRSRPRIDEEPLVEAISETIKQYVFTRENIGDMDTLYFNYYMRDYITREFGSEPDLSWKKIAEILLSCPEEIYGVDGKVNIERALQEGFAKSSHSSMEIAKAHRLICIIKEAREDAIKKMVTVEQRNSKLKTQIEEGDFMATYELVMSAIQKCKEDKRFLPLLNSLDLPANEQTHEHILYIFGIRLVERLEMLKKEKWKVELNELMRDNLNTISFFKLAEIIVEEAFDYVKTRFKERFTTPEDRKNLMKDLANSEYLMVELISRIIYKHISESPKRRQEYYAAIKYYYEEHPFFVELNHQIAEELRHKSFLTEEHWKALGANPAEGHVGLIEKCIIPAAKIGRCVVNCEKYGEAMNELMSIIEFNLGLRQIAPAAAPSC